MRRDERRRVQVHLKEGRGIKVKRPAEREREVIDQFLERICPRFERGGWTREKLTRKRGQCIEHNPGKPSLTITSV